MIQLKLLSGKMAGTVWLARHFPVRIGRATSTDLPIEGDGVWDEHFQIQFVPRSGFRINPAAKASTRINGQPITEPVLLRNGDIIELGAARLQFWLSESRQRALSLREWLTWIVVGAASLGQIGLIYWLLKES